MVMRRQEGGLVRLRGHAALILPPHSHCNEWRWHRELEGLHLASTSLCLGLTIWSDPGNEGPLSCDPVVPVSAHNCTRRTGLLCSVIRLVQDPLPLKASLLNKLINENESVLIFSAKRWWIWISTERFHGNEKFWEIIIAAWIYIWRVRNPSHVLLLFKNNNRLDLSSFSRLIFLLFHIWS